MRRSFPWLKLFSVLLLLTASALIYLDAKVRYGFNERQWQLPARVYARPLVLEMGTALQAEDLAYELALLGYQSSVGAREPGTVNRQGNHFLVHSRGMGGNGRRFRLQIYQGRISRLWDAGGRPLASLQLEPVEIGSIYPRHREDRLLVRLDEVPQMLVDILLEVEDRNFFQHLGVSLRSIARALLVNIRAGETVQGGSTITQQLVKNMYLTSERSLLRKGIEAIMAVLLELHFSKQQILESYLNEVYLGQSGPRAIHGFALASTHYFNQPLTELDASQIALLVGLVKGPSYYDPWRYPERAAERRNTVLQVMAERQLISSARLVQLQSSDLELARDSAVANVFPAYLDLVRKQLRRDYDDKSLQTTGLKIFTAFDPIVQRHAEASLAKELAAVDKETEGAIVVTDVHSGDVVAVIGGRRMRYAGFNRALHAVRPIGSLVKPAVYLSALAQPRQYTLASMISDGPVEVAAPDGSTWRPRNFDRQSHGNVLLHRALAHSYNQATARLGMTVGLGRIVDQLERLGIARNIKEVPSLLLGSIALSPLEVAVMYQTIAAAGVSSPLRSITMIADRQGQALVRYPQQQVRTVDKSLMHLLHYAMLEVVREGTGKAVYQRLSPQYKVAGKTGTSDDLRDSWFAGFAGDYLAVVWLGRDDYKPAGLTGSMGALKVWREFIARASSEPLDFSAPDGVVYRWIDSSSGKLSSEFCDNSRYVPFLLGTAPTERSDCIATLPGVFRWFRNLFD